MEAKRRVEKIPHAPRRGDRGERRDERQVLRCIARELKATLRNLACVPKSKTYVLAPRRPVGQSRAQCENRDDQQATP